MKQKLFFEVDEKNGKQGSIRNRFLISPFSILDTKSGDWRKRRNNWKDLGLKSDEGRGEELVFSVSFDKYGTTKGKPRKQITQGTSVFDPVLCELMYTWFCPAGGQVVDPFCGGSVRGIVAAMLGYSYWGIDIREEQVTANRKQYAEICDGQKEPEWILGDSTVKIKDAPRADFVLSCPPYGDLEKYSDNPKDLSNMSYENFMAGMKKVIQGCYDCLKRNSFACFVISDYRDKSGNYSGFMPDTINAFKAAGFTWYNDIVLVNTIGSLPLRVTKIFNAGRKVGRMHQNVLIFLKGDARAATAKILKEKQEAAEDDGE